MFLENSFNFSD